MKNYFKALIVLTLQNIYIIYTINSISHNNKNRDKNNNFGIEIRKIFDSSDKVNINQIDKRINGNNLCANKKIKSTINIGFKLYFRNNDNSFKYNGYTKEYNFNKISFWSNKEFYSSKNA